MKKQVTIIIVTIGLIFALAAAKYVQISSAIAKAAQRKMPPEAVTSVKAVSETWPIIYSAIGTLAPVQGATLGSEETGRVQKISFESGQVAKEGQVLIELDTSVENAQLKGALAQLDLASITAKRERALREKNANSPAQLDAAEAALRNAEADVSKLKAMIERKKIVAPFTGRTGIRLVNEGQIVTPGTPMVSLQSFDPLYINFSLPQQVVAGLQIGSSVKIVVDAFPKSSFEGSLTTIQPEVDQVTRMIKLQATVGNPEEKLRPGMFARATVYAPQSKEVLRIPASSVQYAPYGDTVYVIEKMKDEKGNEYLGVRKQTVQLAERRGDLIEVTAGLKPGDEIASSGAFKLRPGAPVLVNNSVAPGSELAPRPADT